MEKTVKNIVTPERSNRNISNIDLARRVYKKKPREIAKLKYTERTMGSWLWVSKSRRNTRNQMFITPAGERPPHKINNIGGEWLAIKLDHKPSPITEFKVDINLVTINGIKYNIVSRYKISPRR